MQNMSNRLEGPNTRIVVTISDYPTVSLAIGGMESGGILLDECIPTLGLSPG
jgi:hypothetical protein